MTRTPGPWSYAELMPDGVIIRRAGTFEINTPAYDVCTLVPNGGPIRNEDDARLIAAAPDMLAALEVAESALENTLGEWLAVEAEYLPMGYIPVREALDTVRAEIAKAKGEN
jgi:hypothetical protein